MNTVCMILPCLILVLYAGYGFYTFNLGPLPYSNYRLEKLSENKCVSTMDKSVARTKSMLEASQRNISGMKPKERFVIFVCEENHVCGGFADRQKGLIPSYLISLMLNRTFGIMMTRFCDFTQFVIPNEVNWLINDKRLPQTSVGRIRVLNSDTYGLNFEKGFSDKVFNNDVIYYSANMDYVPSLMHNPAFSTITWARNMSHHDIIKTALKKLFQLSPGTMHKYEKIYNKTHLSNHTLICAHIRVGKSKTLPNDKHRKNSPDLKTLEMFLKNRTRRGSYKLFISTDSEDARSQFHAAFRDIYVEVPGSIGHVDQIQKGVEHDCSQLEKVIVEESILATCDVLIMSVSGISRLAAIIRGYDDGLYIAKLKTITASKRLNPSKTMTHLGTCTISQSVCT